MDKQKEKKKKVLMPFGLRNKLIAAISMLLVSSIMMVSSTYAWFTLSTAPEVKNISTTVAGNGSLEIALMPTDGLFNSIGKGVQGADAKASNTNWGNLIDLTDVSYGLNSVRLNPAVISLTAPAEEGGTYTINGTSPLSIPVYGQDGRIGGLSATTKMKSYAGEAGFNSSNFGVRAIGEPTSDTETAALGDTYGYVVDLALRLNTQNVNADGTTAAGKLLLQTEAAQRIYAGSENTNTMGGGSYMSFSRPDGVDATVMTDKMITGLMKSIRVTFVQDLGKSGGTPKVLGTAVLQIADDATVTADASGQYTAALEMSTSGKYYDAASKTEKDLVTPDGAVLLQEMNKNTAYQISAVVWLDGEEIKNADVAAAAVNSLTGKLNLQFSTDVELHPAMNSELKNVQ